MPLHDFMLYITQFHVIHDYIYVDIFGNVLYSRIYETGSMNIYVLKIVKNRKFEKINMFGKIWTKNKYKYLSFIFFTKLFQVI